MANELSVVIKNLEDCIREAQAMLKQLKTVEYCGEVAENVEGDIERRVTECIKVLGIPAHIKGYQYMRTAILECLDNSEMIDSVTRKLYPTVAVKHRTTPSRVERAIRHAIEVAWNRGNPDALNKIFGYTIDPGKGKPTNSECIAMIVDSLK